MPVTETWRPVVGFETLYEVSDQGRARSLDRVSVYQRRDQYSGEALTVTRRHRGRLLRPGRQSSGHLSVVLGRGNTKLVHVLVLEAFVGPRPAGLESLHGDDSPASNALGNLRWGTRSQNVRDAIRNGRAPIGEAKHNAKLKDADIPEIRAALGAAGVCEVARRHGVDESTIRQVRDGRTWGHVR